MDTALGIVKDWLDDGYGENHGEFRVLVVSKVVKLDTECVQEHHVSIAATKPPKKKAKPKKKKPVKKRTARGSGGFAPPQQEAGCNRVGSD